jgi:hypothetical protein
MVCGEIVGLELASCLCLRPRFYSRAYSLLASNAPAARISFEAFLTSAQLHLPYITALPPKADSAALLIRSRGFVP